MLVDHSCWDAREIGSNKPNARVLSGLTREDQSRAADTMWERTGKIRGEADLICPRFLEQDFNLGDLHGYPTTSCTDYREIMGAKLERVSMC